jgi:prepilin signal peptidase PulO-like enzyme (type II secretory pathway)
LLHGRWINLVLFIGICVPISIIDLKERKIPDILVLVGLIAFLATRIFIYTDISWWVVLDTAVGFTSIFILRFATKGGIGLGDAKLSGLMGFLLGLFYWGIAMFIASLVGVIVGMLLISLKKIKRNEGIPFAPLLAFGGIVSYILKYYIIKDVAGIW